MKRIFSLFTILTLFSLALVGCGGSDSGGKEKKAEGPFRIVTSFYPMYIAAINITQGIEGVEVVNMTKPQTGCLHDYQLSTGDLTTLEKADAFVVNGAGMEAFLDKVIRQQKNLKLIDASKNIPLLKETGTGNSRVP